MRRYGNDYRPGREGQGRGTGEGKSGYDRSRAGGRYGRDFQASPDWRTQGASRDSRSARVWNRPDDRGNRQRGAYDFGYDVTRGFSAFSSRGPYGGYFGSWDLRPMMAGYDRDLRDLRRPGS
jgi:hypothetical protein